MNIDEILDIVREVSGIYVKQADIPLSGDIQGSELLVLELEGTEFADLAAKFGTDGRLLLRWLLPDSAYSVRDASSGHVYTAGNVFRLPAFGMKAKDRAEQGISPLKLSPNLEAEGSTAGSSWLRDVRSKWKYFAEDIAEKGVCTLDNFIRLEAGLNAIFTSAEARTFAGFSSETADEDANPLLVLEAKRQVLIDWPARTLGRLRIPHDSHKKRLCPFQTPESQRTGLQLNLAADADISGGAVRAGKTMLSAAVGLIPYPNHTDGPRLMMGGKNMKQAEPGIRGAEPPIVPGRYEGEAMRSLSVFNSNRKNGRFFPYLGLNALTLIMPFDGYTYEDGVVISESLAERLCIPQGHYRYSKMFDVSLKKSELEQAGIYDPENHGLGKLFGQANVSGKWCVYGDVLPEPRVKFYRDGEPILWSETYRHHAPGTLESIKVKCIINGTSGSDTARTKCYDVKLTVYWSFRVVRKMGLGDKLTGRNGNKGVVTRILPDAKMPLVHFKDEVRPAELIISPVSVMGRKNLGAIWEMTHSLLIKKGGQKLEDFLSGQDVDIKNEPLDGVPGFREHLDEFLAEAGCDDEGLFTVSCDGREDVKAFAGWQYFCRLHHHAWKKLQARGGNNVPYSQLLGQPLQCGSLTGQRMGEMENWSLLSHGAGRILSDMRRKYTGNFGKTRELLRKALRSLGIVMTESEAGLEFRARTEADDAQLERKLVQWTFSRDMKEPFCVMMPSKKKEAVSCRTAAEAIRSRLKDGSTARQLDAVLKDECFFCPDGSLHIEPDVLRGWELERLLLQFCMNGPDFDRAKALIAYRDSLIKIVSGKGGLPRSYFARRRYDHSGRAVIVPEPSLMLHEVYLPAAMLIELLDGYTPEYTSRFPESLRDIYVLRRIFNDYYGRREEARNLAAEFDEFLRTPEGELWCFLIRQPSLHRHSVQSFRVRCWEEPVIGIPPMVTPGFNADFDGDTMAVFLPPFDDARDLRAFSVISNPGLVGTGKPALADDKDIALGWRSEGGEKFSVHLKRLLKEIAPLDFEGRSRRLQQLQMQVMKGSYGAATMSPLEFEHMARKYQDEHKYELDGRYRGMKTMIDAGAKGSMKDVGEMTGSLGIIKMMEDRDNLSIDDKSAFRKEQIDGSFWAGLSDDELFKYSYPSRLSMAHKKLSVAESGYLSRLLAEKLYECTVSIPDCGTDKGLKVEFRDGRLYVDGEPMPEADFGRVLWGRVLAGESGCLDVDDAVRRLKAGETVYIRSPLTCLERETGHVCAACYGADVATRPYDTPEPVKAGFHAGLTAAQAIGERGTQLAMKKFHDVSSNSDDEVTAWQVKKLLIHTDGHSIGDIIRELLAHSSSMNQALIHFELEAAYVRQKEGFLSALAGERVSSLLKSVKDGTRTDDLSGIKSRLLWEGRDK